MHNDLVILVNPPFGAIERPSIGLGLLQQSALDHGINCTCIYANILFAERIGLGLYFWFANTGDYTNLFGEWVFANTVSGVRKHNAHEYIERFIENSYTEATFQLLIPGVNVRQILLEIQKVASDFIDELARDIVAKRPKVVGCSSAFQQNCASLGLLKRFRELDPTIVTLMGGPNCEGSMALSIRKNFPWIDFVVSGEAEESFPYVVKALFAQGRQIDENSLPDGYIGHLRSEREYTQAPRLIVMDLESTPVPNYDDYFDQIVRSNLVEDVSPGILLEASRGCWWGQKTPCTFCGLNGVARKFRKKSPRRIITEINLLCRRYSIEKVEFVDNSMDTRSLRPICTSLSKRKPPVVLFFETRVLNRQQMELMAKGGVKWLQVGIESFHPQLLRIMQKGTTPLENIQVLKWAYQLGIRLTYNLIYGFPGEEDEWYAEMSLLVPNIVHLEPPRHLVPLRYDRFSTFFNEPEKFGLHLAPREAYSYVYDLPVEAIQGFAYFFENTGAHSGLQMGEGFNALKKEWIAWRQAFWTAEPGCERAVLHLLKNREFHLLYDTRTCAKTVTAVLSDLESNILEFCDSARPAGEILSSFTARYGKAAVRNALDRLLELRAVLLYEDKILSLAVTPPKQPLLQTKDFPGGFYYPALSRIGLAGSLGHHR